MEDFTGYTLCYERDEAPVPVYVAGFLATALLVGWYVTANGLLLAVGMLAFAVTYYNFPLAETGRPRLGANRRLRYHPMAGNRPNGPR